LKRIKRIKIGDRYVGEGEPACVIAEIGSNFDGSLERAKMLIDLAKGCGVDAVKFQCFSTDRIISREGFEGLRSSFQEKWGRPVYDVYRSAEFPREWHDELYHYARGKGLQFLSTPYDFEAADILDRLGIPAFKIGSGDITWPEMLKYVARKGKPVLLGAGASTLAEVDEAVRIIRAEGNDDIIVMQCVTNYPSTFECANVRAMRAMGDMFGLPVGYSDHTPGSVVPLGAICLGACVIEKHFTDDKSRKGPDHPFAMDAGDMKAMVDGIRLMEKALGSAAKDLYTDEKDTVYLQRRCLRASRPIARGSRISEDMINVLRPVEEGALAPKYRGILAGRVAKTDYNTGDPFTWDKL
jgi:sialic acid synthase SpsE